MNQLGFDFNKDINTRIYTIEEDQMIDKIVANYKLIKGVYKDDEIITQLFFEEHCIEIVKRLKSDKYFENAWDLTENHLSSIFYNYIISTKFLVDSSITEFVLILVCKMQSKIKPVDWESNSINHLVFDRKITEGILENIYNGNIQNAILALIGYVKIWNHFSIYKKPFNNPKGLLILRIFAEHIWPKDKITYEMYNNFEKLSLDIISNIKSNDLYIPFFDNKQKDYYSINYLKERTILKRNIENLFDYDLTDESEPYFSLIEDLLINPLDFNSNKKKLICSKVDKYMYPNIKDIEMFKKLHESPSNKELGKWLLSKFYLYNCLNYDI